MVALGQHVMDSISSERDDEAAAVEFPVTVLFKDSSSQRGDTVRFGARQGQAAVS